MSRTVHCVAGTATQGRGQAHTGRRDLLTRRPGKRSGNLSGQRTENIEWSLVTGAFVRPTVYTCTTVPQYYTSIGTGHMPARLAPWQIPAAQIPVFSHVWFPEPKVLGHKEPPFPPLPPYLFFPFIPTTRTHSTGSRKGQFQPNPTPAPVFPLISEMGIQDAAASTYVSLVVYQGNLKTGVENNTVYYVVV